MRIILITVGSRGDVEPYVALGLGLKAAGFTVALASHERFRDFVTSYGLLFRPIAGDPHEILQRAAGKTMVAGGRSFIRFLRNLRRLALPYAEAVLRDSLAACADAEVILYSTLAVTGYHVGEFLGVPTMPAILQPAGRTGAFPTITTPPWLRAGRWFNYLSHVLAEQIFWQISRPYLNPWRTRTLGLSRLSFWGPYGPYYRQKRPFLFGYSHHVIPKPADWYEAMAVTGYWFLSPPTTWQPDAELVRFLAAGPAPVYVGFGSMTDREPARLTEIVLGALAQTGQRGILLTGWGGLDKKRLAADIFVVKDVPHHWLFPQMQAAVHHGGAGTTAAGFRAGIPTLIVPFFADQPFWGERAQQLGVGPAPIPRRKLTAAKLAAAISQMVSGKELQSRAARLGEKLRAENGIERAVAHIERYLY